MSTTPTTHNHVDEVLKETEIGSFIANNKGLVGTLLVGIVVGIFAWGGYNTFKSNKNDELSAVVFDFRKANFQNLVEKKMTTADYAVKFETLATETKGFEGLVPLAVLSSDEMLKMGATEDALKVLKSVEGHSNPYMVYFVKTRMAVAHEDLGKYDMAIADLESIVKANIKVMESKTYLDLGRLYVKTGNKEKAKANFKYVMENNSQAEFAKLAKLYTAQLEN